MLITSQKRINQLFRKDNFELNFKKITDYSGKGKMYCADTRVAFADYVDYLLKSGWISEKLADKVTLK